MVRSRPPPKLPPPPPKLSLKPALSQSWPTAVSPVNEDPDAVTTDTYVIQKNHAPPLPSKSSPTSVPRQYMTRNNSQPSNQPQINVSDVT